MNRNKLVTVSILFGLSCVAEVASAGYMRCGAYLVQDGGRHGPGKYEVLKKCGEPSERFGNNWIYERTPHGKKVLTFNDAGLLVNIR